MRARGGDCGEARRPSPDLTPPEADEPLEADTWRCGLHLRQDVGGSLLPALQRFGIYRRTTSVRRFCGSAIPGGVGTSISRSLTGRSLTNPRGVPAAISHSATALARRSPTIECPRCASAPSTCPITSTGPASAGANVPSDGTTAGACPSRRRSQRATTSRRTCSQRVSIASLSGSKKQRWLMLSADACMRAERRLMPTMKIAKAARRPFMRASPVRAAQ